MLNWLVKSVHTGQGRWRSQAALCLVVASLAVGVRAAPLPEDESTPPTGARALPNGVDLRSHFEQWNLPRWQQGDRPTCSVFTVAGALEFALAKQQGHGTRLSVEFLNWASNRTCGDTADGGFFSDLWKGFTRYGICSAETLPYASVFDPTASPPSKALTEAGTWFLPDPGFHWIKAWDVSTGLTEAHLREIQQTLVAGWPVCAGLRWPKQEQWVDGVLQLCPPSSVRDGHSILLTGYRDDPRQSGGGLFVFRNTANAGQDGALPYAYALAYMNDAAWIESTPTSLDTDE